jgi:hypothetical protein
MRHGRNLWPSAPSVADAATGAAPEACWLCYSEMGELLVVNHDGHVISYISDEVLVSRSHT